MACSCSEEVEGMKNGGDIRLRPPTISCDACSQEWQGKTATSGDASIHKWKDGNVM
jgi:hypothetical protein